MKLIQNPILVALLTLSLCSVGLAEDSLPEAPRNENASNEGDTLEPLLKPRYRATKKGRPKRKTKARTLASTSTTRVRGRAKRAAAGPSSLSMGFEAIGGLGFLSAQNPNISDNRSTQGLGQDFIFGARLDSTFARFFGAEVEVISSFSPTQELQVEGGSAFAELKHQTTLMWAGVALASYPIEELQIKPKIGIGYTSSRFTENDSTTTVEHQITSAMTGVFGRVGSTWKPLPDVEIDATFDFLLSGTNELSHMVNGAPSDSDLYPASLTRFRVAGRYAIADEMTAGLEFRTQQIGAVGALPFNTPGVVTPNTSPSELESQMRILALFRYQFL